MLALMAARKKKADVQERQVTLLLPLIWRDYVHALAQRLGCDLQSVWRAKPVCCGMFSSTTMSS